MRRRSLVLTAAIVLTTVGITVPFRQAAATATFAAHVTTPAVAPEPDIVFLADTTGRSTRRDR